MTQIDWLVEDDSGRHVVWDQRTGVYFLLDANDKEIARTNRASTATRWLGKESP